MKRNKEPRSQLVSAAFINYARKVKLFISQKVASLEDAEDIVQDVFYRFSRKFSDPENLSLDEEPENVEAFLITMAKNQIIDSFRKKNVTKKISTEDLDKVYPYEEDLISWNFSVETPEDQYMKNVFNEQLHLCLEELPEDQRVVFLLHEIDGLSFKEISEKLHVPVNTLISRKRYAVGYLRKHLRTFYQEWFD